jgi:hypothetical protein
MAGMTFMFFCLIAIGGLGWAHSKSAQMAIGILLVISTLANMITIGPVCYPIVAETPSGRLRYKTIVIGRFVYNLTGIFSNSVTPRMISSTCKSSPLNQDKDSWIFEKYADIFLLLSLELGSQSWSLLCRHQPSLQHLVLVPPS